MSGNSGGTLSNDRVHQAGLTPAALDLPAKMSLRVSRQVVTALNQWLAGLNGPQNPPFCLHQQFSDSEWSHFFRILCVSTALASTVAVAHTYATKLLAPVVPNALELKVLCVFACFGVIYSLYSRLFGITISVRQSLFCFALVTTPWLPVYVLVKSLGGKLGLVWFVLMLGLGIYVFYLCARAVRIVSGAGLFRVLLSFGLALVLAIAAVATSFAVQEPAANPATATPAGAQP